MSDVIKFDEFRNKAKDREVDKFEEYIYSLYYKMAEGKMTMADLNREIMNYMNEHGITPEEFNEIQIKLVERYGFDAEELKKNLSQGVDRTMSVAMVLKGKYGDSLNMVQVMKKVIKNEKNDLILFCENNEITIYSEKRVELDDNELHDFLVSYRRQFGEESLNIRLSDNFNVFTY